MARKRIFAMPALASLGMMATGCTDTPADVAGTWESEISEPALFLSGTERLHFNPDSTFLSTSEMKFEHGDSTLSSTLGIRVSISGVWEQPADHTVTMAYDPESLEVDTIAGTFTLRHTGGDSEATPDSILALMRENLFHHISAHYKGAYAHYDPTEYVTLTEVRVSGNPPTLSATIGPIRIKWISIGSDQ